MSNISIVRALPLAAGGSDIAKRAFDEMRGPRKSGAADYIKNIVKMTGYYAWLQQGSAGDFLVEYWESPYTWEEIAANVDKAADTPHLRWAHEQITKMMGVKPETPLDLTFEAMSDWPDKGGKTGLASPTGFALPILPGKIGLLKETIGEYRQGSFKKDAEAHLKKMQTVRWISNLQHMSGKDFYVQYLELEHDLPTSAGIFDKATDAYANRMEEKFREFSGVDFRAADGWPKSTLLAELKDLT